MPENKATAYEEEVPQQMEGKYINKTKKNNEKSCRKDDAISMRPIFVYAQSDLIKVQIKQRKKNVQQNSIAHVNSESDFFK